MVLPIYLYGQKVLRKRAAEVSEVTPELAKLADDMLETMYKSAGIGLAAPQVGKGIRLIVVDVAGEDEEKRPYFLFNPVVSVKKGRMLMRFFAFSSHRMVLTSELGWAPPVSM